MLEWSGRLRPSCQSFSLWIAYQALTAGRKSQHYPMLQRNLVYTAVTRGKRLVVLVGQKKALSIAVRGQQTRRRWSKLKEWLALEPARGQAVATASPVPGTR